MKYKLSKVLLIIGSLIILGAAGDSDAGHTPFELVVIKLVLGLFLCAVGFFLHRYSCNHIKIKKQIGG